MGLKIIGCCEDCPFMADHDGMYWECNHPEIKEDDQIDDTKDILNDCPLRIEPITISLE